MSIIQTLFSAKGRIRRRDYWLWAIVIDIVFHAANLIAHQVLANQSIAQYFTDYLKAYTFRDFSPFSLFVLGTTAVRQWPGLCLMAKRWHDRNRSGYLAGGIIGFNWMVVLGERYFSPAATHTNLTIYYGLAFVSVAIALWVFVDLGCLDGTKGPNKYGPSPKQIQAPVDVF